MTSKFHKSKYVLEFRLISESHFRPTELTPTDSLSELFDAAHHYFGPMYFLGVGFKNEDLCINESDERYSAEEVRKFTEVKCFVDNFVYHENDLLCTLFRSSVPGMSQVVLRIAEYNGIRSVWDIFENSNDLLS